MTTANIVTTELGLPKKTRRKSKDKEESPQVSSILQALETKPLKYIRYCEGSVRVKIERKGLPYLCQHFKIRTYGSLERAVKAAITWRDKKHIETFGYPVSEKIYQLGNRRVEQKKIDPATGLELESLPPGLSYSFHRKALLYIVVSFQRDGRPAKERFSIKRLGMAEAIQEATKFRLGIFSN